MLFNSLQFLIFFAVIFFAYYELVPDRYRWILLLAGSCYFYMAYIPSYVLILFGLIIVDYCMGHAIAGATGPRRRKFLIVSLVVNLGALFFFKYFDFFNANAAAIAHLIHWNYPLVILQIALPLGLSFHIFQSLSYVVEVYRGKQQPERNLGIYALYVMFFPQLVAGPIERPQHMLHQFHEPHSFRAIQVRRGLELVLWGFFKKMVIADGVAVLVDHVYANVASLNGFIILIAAVAFSYQIYCDFSGYSDIAVGSALVFGYDLTQNFNRPFSSTSIAELWRRWHISLSSWLRDYLYYPLAFAGKKITKLRLYLSMLLTFTLIGLWHGANWTYVFFGALQGAYIVFSMLTVDLRKRISELVGLVKRHRLLRMWQVVSVFALFTASLVFFRADSVGQALQVFAKIRTAPLYALDFFMNLRQAFTSEDIGIGLKSAAVIVSGIILMEWIQCLQARQGSRFMFENKSRAWRWGWYYLLIFSILVIGNLGAQTFIYFKF